MPIYEIARRLEYLKFEDKQFSSFLHICLNEFFPGMSKLTLDDLQSTDAKLRELTVILRNIVISRVEITYIGNEMNEMTDKKRIYDTNMSNMPEEDKKLLQPEYDALNTEIYYIKVDIEKRMEIMKTLILQYETLENNYFIYLYNQIHQ
ncbi:hypothetical protein GVAV_000267 [Gurleya vavrai]